MSIAMPELPDTFYHCTPAEPTWMATRDEMLGMSMSRYQSESPPRICGRSSKAVLSSPGPEGLQDERDTTPRRYLAQDVLPEYSVKGRSTSGWARQDV